jgi:hypothetical protein
MAKLCENIVQNQKSGIIQTDQFETGRRQVVGRQACKLTSELRA